MESKIIYLSGPMTGYPNFNIETFNFWTEFYETCGYKVHSPPQISPVDGEKEYQDYLRSDLNVLINEKIDAVYVLPGWEKSKGALLEARIAMALNIPVFDVRSEKPVMIPISFKPQTIADEAYNLVYGDRAAAYGHPLDDYQRLSGAINSIFKENLKKDFSPLDMALFMMLVKISRLVHSPTHRDSLVDVAGYVLVYEKMLERIKSETPSS
jgi:hypothetical protein